MFRDEERDDLPDGGAGHFASTIKAIREKTSHAKMEVLIPDFLSGKKALTELLKGDK